MFLQAQLWAEGPYSSKSPLVCSHSSSRGSSVCCCHQERLSVRALSSGFSVEALQLFAMELSVLTKKFLRSEPG